MTGEVIQLAKGRKDRAFVFEVKLFATIEVAAADEPEARALLMRTLDCATVDAGSWPNGEPALFEVVPDGEEQLLSIDGEPC